MAIASNLTTTTATAPRKGKKLPLWYRPTLAPEHGVFLVLLGSFVTGAALAQHWTNETTIALVAAFFTLQVEHPYVVQIKLRKNWKPRFLLWGGVYSAIAIYLAILLWLQSPVLIWIYALVIIGFIADGIAVLQRRHKSIANEIVSFAGICLATPLAYGATTGSLSPEAMAMWILNTLFFSSAIFTIKLRRKRTRSLQLGLIYHGIATLMVFGLYSLKFLSLVTALSFAVVLVKFGVITCVLDWYRKTRFQFVAIFETRFALLYIAIASVSVLPAHLPPQ